MPKNEQIRGIEEAAIASLRGTWQNRRAANDHAGRARPAEVHWLQRAVIIGMADAAIAARRGWEWHSRRANDHAVFVIASASNAAIIRRAAVMIASSHGPPAAKPRIA